jgi:uncharacterized protein (UPF0332 family)
VKRINQFLTLAEEELATSQLLLNNQHCRAGVSRAYYAMYYATQALLTAKNITSRTHKGVIQQFSQHFIKTGDFPVSMAQDLKRNYDLRQLSDYEEAIALTQEQATQALAGSIEFVSRVRVYLDENSQGADESDPLSTD